MTLEEIFNAFRDLHVMVVGDVMIDRYYWGEVDRISPEAPVPVVSIRRAEDRLGGAGNVALNCRALGAKVSLASVVGMDSDADALLRLLGEYRINPALILRSPDRKTTVKTRILSKNQQMLRFDQELEEDLMTKDEHAFIDSTLRYLQIQKPDIVIFEDYNKGVLKENVIQKVVRHCKNLNILIAVDPKKKNFLAYQGVDIFKPNLKEVREGLNISLATPDTHALEDAHNLLQQALGHDTSLITLSEYGVFVKRDHKAELIPTIRRNIADVSGAGDTVIAIAAMVYAVTKDVYLMAKYSNVAGGLVCEEVGVVPVNREKLFLELQKLGEPDN